MSGTIFHKQLRVYCDTSVFGGCFDDEFAEVSRDFFEDIKKSKFLLVISGIVLAELNKAPDFVQKVLADLPDKNVEILEFSDEIAFLRDAYLKTGIVGAKIKADAEHIAAASVADVDFVTSWNFKHIVHYEKINGYQSINLINGYREIRIYSPREVVDNG